MSNPVLLISHPGHELRLHGWLEQTHPVVLVLTQGDGAHGTSRLASTTRVLERAGAQPGSVYGPLSDRDIYAALRLGQCHVFTELLARLASEIMRADATCVVADAEEGYNPSHDVCHYLATAAADLASAGLKRPIELFDFLLVGAPTDCPSALRERARWLRLDDAALHRKLAAAAAYPELRTEVERALAAHGPEAFRTECLRPVTRRSPFPTEVPFYERHGERRVAEGAYADVIRFMEHVQPLRSLLCAEGRAAHERAGVAPA